MSILQSLREVKIGINSWISHFLNVFLNTGANICMIYRSVFLCVIATITQRLCWALLLKCVKIYDCRVSLKTGPADSLFGHFNTETLQKKKEIGNWALWKKRLLSGTCCFSWNMQRSSQQGDALTNQKSCLIKRSVSTWVASEVEQCVWGPCEGV